MAFIYEIEKLVLPHEDDTTEIKYLNLKYLNLAG